MNNFRNIYLVPVKCKTNIVNSVSLRLFAFAMEWTGHKLVSFWYSKDAPGITYYFNILYLIFCRVIYFSNMHGKTRLYCFYKHLWNNVLFRVHKFMVFLSVFQVMRVSVPVMARGKMTTTTEAKSDRKNAASSPK